MDEATLAQRLAEALRERRLSDRGAARELKRRGVTISHAYIGLLRKGAKTNPTREHLEAFADLTGKSVDWLLGRDTPVLRRELTPEEQAKLEQARLGLADLGVQNVAERMMGLSQLSVDAILKMVEAMRAAEGADEEESMAADEAWFERD
ncbi:hypothetical protein ACFWYW_46965 [Nonomuraea sp. NPDC059023]|uniref:hypothetical protein n=1 Tax=unclassified Nonomuraea TaxID=2593643 RepID=UPI0036975FCA